MGKRISISVGTEVFESKTRLKEKIRILIGKYGFGSILNDEDSKFCCLIFQRHFNAIEKFGLGISRIEVRKDEYGNRYFHIVRVDGTDTDISWVNCITPKSR
jgi:hypothetical protein